MFGIILKEVKKVSITTVVMAILIIFVSAAIRMFDDSIIYSVLFGTLYTVSNFALLGTIAAKAITFDKRKAKVHMIVNNVIRYLITAFVMYVSFIAPYLNGWVVTSFLFAPKITYYSIEVANMVKNLFTTRKD